MVNAQEVTSLKATDLPPTIDEEELRLIFGRDLISVQLPRSSTGENCGYAILGFSSPESAEKAMSRNGQRLPQRKVLLRLAPCSTVSGKRPLASYQLCVGNLAPQVSDADLYTAFRSFSGEVLGARVPADGSGRNRGYGFLRLSDDEAAGPLATKAHGFPVAGRAVTVRQCLPADAAAGDRTLFVSNLEPGTREDWVRKLLGVFGDLDFVEQGGHGGVFARVGFGEAEAALAAASLLQGRAQSSGRQLRIRWAKPLSSDHQRLQAFSQRFATPKVAEPRDDMARELAKSLLPQPTTAERQVEGSGMDTSDQAHWLSKQLASQGPEARKASESEGPAAKSRKIGES